MESSPYGHNHYKKASLYIIGRPLYNHCDHKENSPWIMQKIAFMMSKFFESENLVPTYPKNE